MSHITYNIRNSIRQWLYKQCLVGWQKLPLLETHFSKKSLLNHNTCTDDKFMLIKLRIKGQIPWFRHEWITLKINLTHNTHLQRLILKRICKMSILYTYLEKFINLSKISTQLYSNVDHTIVYLVASKVENSFLSVCWFSNLALSGHILERERQYSRRSDWTNKWWPINAEILSYFSLNFFITLAIIISFFHCWMHVNCL